MPRRQRRRANWVRGQRSGHPLLSHRTQLAAGLERGDPILRLSARGQATDLHDQRNWGAELENPSRRTNPGPLPQWRGRSQIDLSGA
jgi:hypothetical protein